MLIVLASTLAVLAGGSAAGSDTFGENCSGTETVQLTDHPPTTIPYALTFSVDLGAKTYCYDRCGSDQTFAIDDIGSDRIRLADQHREGQVRELIFDRRAGSLTDHQIFDAGLGPIVRSASATCRSTPFRKPARLTQPRS